MNESVARFMRVNGAVDGLPSHVAYDKYLKTVPSKRGTLIGFIRIVCRDHGYRTYSRYENGRTEQVLVLRGKYGD